MSEVLPHSSSAVSANQADPRLANHPVLRELAALYQRYVQVHQQQGKLWHDFDPKWPSPCNDLTDAADGRCPWQLYWRVPSVSFQEIGDALGVVVHSDLEALFGSHFSEHLSVTFQGHPYTLLLPWNDDDFNALAENLIGHMLMQRKRKVAASWFIGISNEREDWLLTVSNDNGQVQLEPVGMSASKVLAPSLADFLSECLPD